MVDDPNLRAPIEAGRLFPWLRLVPAVTASLDPKRLLLAALGLILLQLGWAGLDRLLPRTRASTPVPITRQLPTEHTDVLDDIRSAPWRLTEPVRALVEPFLGVFSARSRGWTFLHRLLAALWGVVVWSLLGGAIARIAVVQAARGERIGLPEALRFAIRKAVPLLSAPLSPLVGVAFFAVLVALFGLLYRIPTLGPVIAGALAFLPLLAGLTMALILFGLAVGWPLMPASVAAETEDGFDSLSRAFAYVHQRPVPYAAYLALAWVLGTAGLVVVDLFAGMVGGLTEWGLSFSAPGNLLSTLFGALPGAGPTSTAGRLHTFWLSLVSLLAHAWIFSYFWTVVTRIYLLLRRDVDGTSWDDVAITDRSIPPIEATPNPPRSPAGSEAEAHESVA
jgi:hypothetical protein